MGQGFFSLSIGMGALITYGSYVQKDDNLTSTAFSVMISDTLVAILAGLVIFPAAFTFGVKPQAGMELVFDTLPMLFNQIAGGYWFCLIFFILLAIAGLTSTIALLEVVVAYLSEELHLSRKWVESTFEICHFLYYQISGSLGDFSCVYQRTLQLSG